MITINNMPKGFLYNERRIYYMDCVGKDSGFDRWRIYGYYESHKAITIFLPSELEYNQFINLYKFHCFDNFAEFDAKINLIIQNF